MKINEVYLKGQEQAKGYNNPNKIIIHHPEFYGPIEKLNDIMISMGFYMIGYNYYIRKDGSIWNGRPDWATSGNCYGQNNCSLGVCFEGNYDVDKEMPEEQFSAGVELIRYLMGKYSISEVDGHKKYANTACPGKNFPLENMLAAIKKEKKYYVVTDYLKQDANGYINTEPILPLFQNIRFYLRNNANGVWIETQYLDYSKCLELKQALGSLFYNIKED